MPMRAANRPLHLWPAVLLALAALACPLNALARGIDIPAPPPASPAEAAPFDPFSETPAQRDARMAWWRSARFGMFIHWGLYAIPAGRWGDSTHHAEWIRTTAQIPLETYDQFLAQFNPVNFDARAWARTARDAGMHYIVITTKHHDGFCLWDSAHTDFDVMSTPFRRDIIRELCDAARAEGLRVGFYHSIMDWHHPDYLPRRPWETNRPADNADFDRFVAYLHAQVTELLTNYGPISVMWFDGEWEDTWTEPLGRDLYALCRRLQPSIIVNNRVAKARDGMAGLSLEGHFAADFGTPEQEVPPTGLPGVDWESCMTMNDHWGYNAFDTRWKSSATLIRTLADIASKGGNFLLNVGPRADGTFPPESIDRLRDIGQWMSTNAHAIHATNAGPFRTLPWGRATLRRDPNHTTRTNLLVFDWPADARLAIPGLASTPADIILHTPAGPRSLRAGNLSFTHQQGNLVVQGLPQRPPFPECSVLTILTTTDPDIFDAPSIDAPAFQFIDTLTVSLAHPRAAEFDASDSPLDLRYTLDNTNPTATSPIYDGPLILHDSTTLRVQAWRGHIPLSPVSTRTFEKVAPLLPVTLNNPQLGLLHCAHYHGTWDRLPRFNTLTPIKTDTTPGVTLDTRTRDELIAQRFTGYLYVSLAALYRFELTSDDGSRLYLHDQLIIDNDGLHVPEARQGTIALSAGWHPITIEYFNRAGGYHLALRGEIVERPLTTIPPRAFAIEAP